MNKESPLGNYTECALMHITGWVGMVFTPMPTKPLKTRARSELYRVENVSPCTQKNIQETSLLSDTSRKQTVYRCFYYSV